MNAIDTDSAISDLAGHGGLLFLDDRLRQPRSDVGLATDTRGSQVVDGQARGESREVRLGRLDRDALLARPMETQERLLDDVLGLGDAADHPIGDGEGQGPVGGDLRFRRGGGGLGRGVGHHYKRRRPPPNCDTREPCHGGLPPSVMWGG